MVFMLSYQSKKGHCCHFLECFLQHAKAIFNLFYTKVSRF